MVTNHVGNAFLPQHLGLSLDKIAPTVSNRFERITLVNRNKTERLTIDFDIRFINCETHAEQLMEYIVIIELKREGHAASPILPILRKLRIKPAGFSKYCVGATVTTPNLRVNRFKKRLISIHKVALWCPYALNYTMPYGSKANTKSINLLKNLFIKQLTSAHVQPRAVRAVCSVRCL